MSNNRDFNWKELFEEHQYETYYEEASREVEQERRMDLFDEWYQEVEEERSLASSSTGGDGESGGSVASAAADNSEHFNQDWILSQTNGTQNTTIVDVVNETPTQVESPLPQTKNSQDSISSVNSNRDSGFNSGVLDAIYTPANRTTAKLYKGAAGDYLKYCDEEGRTDITSESCLCNYFYDALVVKKTFGLGSVWHKYSCINNYMKKNFQKNLNTYTQLRTFMTNTSSRHIPKKSGTITFEEFEIVTDNMMDNVRRYNSHEDRLMVIAVVLLWYGLLRGNEVFLIDVRNVTLIEHNRSIKINITKPTKTRRTGFSFRVPTKYYDVFDAYLLEIHPTAPPSSRFLKYYVASKKFRTRNAGPKLLTNIRGRVERKLPHLIGTVTNHMWRRSAATRMADRGANSFQIKMAGRWNSLNTAEGYVAESNRRERQTMRFLGCDGAEDENVNDDFDPIIGDEGCRLMVSNNKHEHDIFVKFERNNLPFYSLKAGKRTTTTTTVMGLLFLLLGEIMNVSENAIS